MTDNSDICLVYLRVGDDERRLGKRVFRLGGGGGGGVMNGRTKIVLVALYRNCACSLCIGTVLYILLNHVIIFLWPLLIR